MSPKARDDLVWWSLVLILNGLASWLMEIPFWLLPAAAAAYVVVVFAIERFMKG